MSNEMEDDMTTTVENGTIPASDTAPADAAAETRETGVDTDAEGDSVQGGYRMAYIINTDKSEMILVYAAGLSVGEDDQKVLSDIDDILGNAVATTAANSY